jgi:hypothetical protein
MNASLIQKTTNLLSPGRLASGPTTQYIIVLSVNYLKVREIGKAREESRIVELPRRGPWFSGMDLDWETQDRAKFVNFLNCRGHEYKIKDWRDGKGALRGFDRGKFMVCIQHEIQRQVGP